MIVHIGENIALFEKDIVAILDINSALESEDSRFFISNLIKNNRLINNLNKDVKTYIITMDSIGNIKNGQNYSLYMSNISSTSLLKRINRKK